MEAPKPVKKQRVRSFIKRNRKAIIKTVGVLVILGVTAGVFYNLGLTQASKNSKAKASATFPDLTKLKKSTKENLKKIADESKGNNPASSSSGFFRLSGTIQSVKKGGFTIKLADGSVVTLVAGETTKYYTATPRTAKPISDLKVGTTAFVIGTIGPTGSFTVNNVQAQK